MPAAKNFFALTIYVSPEGNDYFRGIKPELDKENNGPKATLLGAVNEIALLAKAGTIKGPVNVLLRGGRYFLKKTVIFLPAHSYPIIFESYPGEEAIIDGGSRISSWKPANLNGRKIWQADVKELLEQRGRFRQLFVNNLRATPSRYPKKGFVRMEEVKIPDITDLLGGQDRFKASPDGFSATWRNPQSLDIMILNYWISTRLPVKSFNADTREVVLSMTSTFMMRDESGDGSFAKYFVENVVEELSEPGEWALDTAAGILYYVPRPGETIKQAEAFVSHVKQLLVFEGAPDSHEYIEHLSFRNLAFEHSDWGEPVNSIQSDVLVPGTISATGTRFVNFEHCRFEHLGCYAIKFGDGCFSNSVVGCTIRDIGAGGIIANGSDATGSLARRNGDNSYTDNVITQCGRVFMCACGIITQHSYGNLIAHNTISDLYYTGISCGWVWGYADSVSKENRIEYNHIFNLGQGVLSDMGGVYLLGIQPGTRVYNNLIHDIERAKYGGWGIYPDEGSSHVVIENNVVYNTSSSSFHQHYGR